MPSCVVRVAFCRKTWKKTNFTRQANDHRVYQSNVHGYASRTRNERLRFPDLCFLLVFVPVRPSCGLWSGLWNERGPVTAAADFDVSAYRLLCDYFNRLLRPVTNDTRCSGHSSRPFCCSVGVGS